MELFDLPTSVVLALWAPGPSSRGIGIVEGDDGAHEVDDSTSPWGLGRLPLAAWLAAAGPPAHSFAVLVSPAEPVAALPGATDAGECVVLETAAGRSLALVPETSGTSRVWRAHDTPSALVPEDAAQARRNVHAATEEAIDVLTRLDLARERPELADALTDLITAVVDPALLPPWVDPRRKELLERSLRLGAICEVALDDDGAASTALQADRRSRALRSLEAAARRGVGAATEHWAR